MGEVEHKYQVMPPLSEEEFQALKEDIAEHGIKIPVVKDTNGNIIDGHHRVRAYKELFAEGRITEGTDTGGYPTFECVDATEQEMRNLAWSLNLQRRHLDRAQKREAVRAKLKESPEWTDTRIAKLLGVSDKTVRSVRDEAEAVSEIPKLDKLVGADGKEYPRHRVRETSPVEEVPAEKPGGTALPPRARRWVGQVAGAIEGGIEKELAKVGERANDEKPESASGQGMTTERPGQPGVGMTPARKRGPEPAVNHAAPHHAERVINRLRITNLQLDGFAAKDSAEVILRSTDEDVEQARTEAIEAAAWLDRFLEVLDGKEEEQQA